MNREAIATALSTVAGVQGYAYRRANPEVGDAWPLLSGFQRDDQSPAFFVNTRVFVFLPQDEQAASDWIDSHWIDLVDALNPMGYVVSVEPVGEPISQTAEALYLQITMRGE